jgi:hypothetical protein
MQQVSEVQEAEGTLHALQPPENIQGQLKLVQVVDLGKKLAEEGFGDADLAGFALRETLKRHGHT